MDRGLETPAYQVKFGIPSKEPGWLHLESDGFISFKYHGDLVFLTPLQEVRASFPKVTFGPFPFFGAGIKLAVGGKTYRLLFVPVEYDDESTSTGGVGSPFGRTWSFSWQDIKQGRATAQQWRAALGQLGMGGQA